MIPKVLNCPGFPKQMGVKEQRLVQNKVAARPGMMARVLQLKTLLSVQIKAIKAFFMVEAMVEAMVEGQGGGLHQL